jgi:hypothetical protein
MVLALINWLARLLFPAQPLRVPVIIERRIRR